MNKGVRKKKMHLKIIFLGKKELTPSSNFLRAVKKLFVGTAAGLMLFSYEHPLIVAYQCPSESN